MKQAVVFLAWGDKYINEVHQCIINSQFPDDVDFILITDEMTKTAALDEKVDLLIRAKFERDGLLRKTELCKFLPENYYLFMFLDSDTRVIEDISLGFEKAKLHELALSPAPHYSLDYFWGFDIIMKKEGIACKGQMQYNTGVIFFKNSPKIQALFEEWMTLALRHHNEFTNDQPYFTLALEKLGINPYTLSISYNYRGFGDPISGLVRIWHSHGDLPERINKFECAWPPRRAIPGKVIFKDQSLGVKFYKKVKKVEKSFRKLIKKK